MVNEGTEHEEYSVPGQQLLLPSILSPCFVPHCFSNLLKCEYPFPPTPYFVSQHFSTHVRNPPRTLTVLLAMYYKDDGLVY